jgi:type II secretory pathway component PulK
MGVGRDTIVDSIMDWHDGNDLHRLNGAEADYYQSKSPPYYAKNGDFSSVEELLLVRGMTPRIFHALGRKKRRAAADLLTVHGGTGEPNYNTAPPEVLRAVLGSARAEEVINTRKENPYKDEKGKSSVFTVVAEGRPEGSEGGRRIKAVVKRAGEGKGEAVILHWNDLYVHSDIEHAEG